METRAPGKQPNRWGASYPSQLSILFLRALKTRRFESLSLPDILQFAIVGFLCGAFLHHSSLYCKATNHLEVYTLVRMICERG